MDLVSRVDPPVTTVNKPVAIETGIHTNSPRTRLTCPNAQVNAGTGLSVCPPLRSAVQSQIPGRPHTLPRRHSANLTSSLPTGVDAGVQCVCPPLRSAVQPRILGVHTHCPVSTRPTRVPPGRRASPPRFSVCVHPSDRPYSPEFRGGHTHGPATPRRIYRHRTPPGSCLRRALICQPRLPQDVNGGYNGVNARNLALEMLRSQPPYPVP